MVTGGSAASQPWYDLTVSGSGFGAFEGLTAHVDVSSRVMSNDRHGVGQAPVQQGAFSLFFSQVAESGYYKKVALYIDQNGNGSCDASEPVWTLATGASPGNHLISVTPDHYNFDHATAINWSPTPGACTGL